MLKRLNFRKNYIYYILFFLAISVIAFNHVIELRGEEPRRAVVSLEMVESGNYIVPHLFDLPYLNKPPFFNWVLACNYFITDSFSEFSVRLPGVLSFLLTGFFIFLLGRKYQGKELALLCTGAYYTFADLLFFGTINAGEIDLLFSLIIFLQAITIFWFFEKGNWLLLFILSYLLTGIAFLTKGIPALGFQGLTLLAYFILNRQFKKLLSWQHVLGIFLLLAIVLGFFYTYSRQNDMVSYAINLFKETSQRTANEHSPSDILLTLLIFPFYLFRFLLPWSLFAPLLFMKTVRQKIARDPWLRFCAIFILANIIVYSTAPEMRIRYMYMFFPFFAILLISSFQIAFDQLKTGKKIIEKIFNAIIAVSGIAAFIVPFLAESTPAQYIISFTTGIILLVIAYRFFSTSFTISQLWMVIATCVFIRFEYNVLGMSYTQKYFPFREMTKDMIRKTDGNPILYTGDLVILHPNLSLAGNTFYEDTVYAPRDIVYQIAYYHKLYTGSLFRHTASLSSVDSSGYFLTFEDALDTSRVKVLGRYPDVFPNQHLVLFQYGR